MVNERRIGIAPTEQNESTRKVLREIILDLSLKLTSDPCAGDQLENTITSIINPTLAEAQRKGDRPHFYLFTEEDPEKVAQSVESLQRNGKVGTDVVETMTVIKTGGTIYINRPDLQTGLGLVEIPAGMQPYNYEQPIPGFTRTPKEPVKVLVRS